MKHNYEELQQIFTFLFLPEEETTLAENTNNSNNGNLQYFSLHVTKVETKLFWCFLSEEETTEADNNNGGTNLPGKLQYYSWPVIKVVSKPLCFLEEDTSGASVMWKLISSSFAVLLFLLL